MDKQSELVAKKILKKTMHNIDLELQSVNTNETKLHQEELVAELKNKLDRRLWSENE